MSAPQFLPWQLETARNWLGNRERFAHAWLVHGLAGIGKLDFAGAAASLLCETPQDGWPAAIARPAPGSPAATIPTCAAFVPKPSRWKRAPRPPNRPRTPSRGRQRIRARRPRNPHRPDPRIGILVQHRHPPGRLARGALYPAHALNVVSANALLKVLEEPPPTRCSAGGGCARPAVADPGVALPPPALPAPDADTALQWLREQNVEPAREWLAAGGAPLAAARRRAARPPVPMAGPVGRAAGAGPVARCGHAGRGAGKGAGDRLDRRAATLLYRPDAGRRRCAGALLPRWARRGSGRARPARVAEPRAG